MRRGRQARFKRSCGASCSSRYLYDKDVSPVDFPIEIVELWGIPREDVPTFKQDWDTIVNKIRAGHAHELSGSDTLYLEAATKASSSSDRRPQPFSPVPAKPRAWAIKQSYMTVTFNEMLKVQSIKRECDEVEMSLLELVRHRFEPHFGARRRSLRVSAGTTQHVENPKNLCALITKHILGIDEYMKIAEFEKAGIKAKTMRLKRNGMPKESISFPTFSYLDLAERPFEESDFLGYLRQKYLFVIYREDDRERDTYKLSEVLFWQMPDADLLEARRCYEEMQGHVRAGHAELSVKSTENRCCHVRPHGRNKADTLPTPYGTQETKKCFWLNARYIGEEIDKVMRNNAGQRAHAALGNERSIVDETTIRVAELFAGVGGVPVGPRGLRCPRAS